MGRITSPEGSASAGLACEYELQSLSHIRNSGPSEGVSMVRII
ncbi:hypothetical protein EDD80_1343, partial [Anseongella ginsenosidimutans]